jgi:hypothetical protein
MPKLFDVNEIAEKADCDVRTVTALVTLLNAGTPIERIGLNRQRRRILQALVAGGWVQSGVLAIATSPRVLA